MKNPLLLLFIVFPALAFAQDKERKLLLGQIVTSAMDVENIKVLNKTSNIFAVSDNLGKFVINAREKDTLVFSGMAFLSKILVIVESDFDYEVLKVRLEAEVNELEEVIIFPVKLTGNLDADSKKIKTKTYGLDFPYENIKALPKHMQDQSNKAPKNTSLPVVESQLTGIDFNLIGETILGWISKPKPKEKKVARQEDFLNFSEAARQKYSYHFFTQTLKLRHDEIGLFLNYCDGAEAREKKLLRPENAFELTDYLIKKSVEFHKMNQK